MMKYGSLDVVKMILDHHKFGASFMLYLDPCRFRYCNPQGWPIDDAKKKEIQRFVLQHPKMKIITDFARDIESMKKNLK